MNSPFQTNFLSVLALVIVALLVLSARHNTIRADGWEHVAGLGR
jgi:hypothetical protein